MQFSRASGILLHPTSLPGRFGIGDMGTEAYEFVDVLHDMNQAYWQILPLGPTGYGNSPYQSLSAFAGNPLLISPERLFQESLLSRQEVVDHETNRLRGIVDFAYVNERRPILLRRAFDNFNSSGSHTLKESFACFQDAEREWLDDYALYSALKSKHGGVAWRRWEPALAKREGAAIKKATLDLSAEIEEQKFLQFLFFRQWLELKNYCSKQGIRIIGDMPIFVADDSSDVWCEPQNFKLDAQGNPLVVAGVPPDYFSATGQLWGNPIFDWNNMERDGFKWWIKRLQGTLVTADVVRIDHFRGFAACWEIPYGDPTAEFGQWVSVPGQELFSALSAHFKGLPIIAEDLGVITPDVEALRDGFGFPGMRILQMAFRDSTNSDLPHNHVHNSVVYTGTHDNDTIVGWFNSTAGENSTRDADQIVREKNFCLAYLHSDGSDIHWDFIREALSSVSVLCVIPLQDILGLGANARMNVPGTTENNWLWRFESGDLSETVTEKLKSLTVLYARDRGTNSDL